MATATREEQLKDYCQSELAKPFRQYLWGVVKREVTSAGHPLEKKSELIEQNITEKIAIILEPQLNFFTDSLLNSLSHQKTPLLEKTIKKVINTHLEKFLLAVFSSSEAKAIENQVSSAHEIVSEELRVQNGKHRRTDTMPRLNPIMSDKLIEKVIKQDAENIFKQRALGDSLPVLERMSDTLGTDECKRVFSLISDTLTQQLEQIETIRGRQKTFGQ